MIAWLLVTAVALSAQAATAQSFDSLPESRFVKQRERFTPEGGAPLDLHFAIAREAAGQTTRFATTTHAALTLMSAWFGPPFRSSLNVAGVFSLPGGVPGWRPGANVVSVPVHWLTPARDQRTERQLIHGIVREYWVNSRAPSAFEDALIAYTATRATHQLLEGSNFATLTYFGGFVPFPLRAVLLSPPVADPRPRAWRFDEPDRAVDAEIHRHVRAFQVIERYAGWPTMLAALARLRLADRRDGETFAATLSEVRGSDLRPLVIECLRADAVFDYSLDGLQSQPGSTGLTETTLAISRRGNAMFALRNTDGDREAAMPVLVRFADGTEARDFFDGAASSATLVYSTTSPSIGAVIDPDLMLLLDVNRENNTIVREPPTSRLGVRLALHWMTWLQNAMLSYTALL